MCDKREIIYGFRSGKKVAEASPSRLVEKGIKCDFVLLSVWNIANDGSDTNLGGSAASFYAADAFEIYWGFDAECVHPIFPMETSNLLIPVKDAMDIFVRRNKAKGTTTMVGFSCFRKELVDK